MTVKEFARLGGKTRWKGKTKKERSEAMKKIRNKPKNGDMHKQALDEQAR